MSDHAGRITDEAVRLATRGWYVFPVRRNKAPATPSGFKDAVVDPDEVRALFSSHPASGIGIRTGKESGLLVLDVDPDKGGEQELADLIDVHGPLPTTVESITGGGGRHIYFVYPEGSAIRCSAGKLGAGLDVRADGGYVVAPPSPHDSGTRYAWKGSDLDQFDLAAPPAWLVDLLNGAVRPSKTKASDPPVSEPMARVLDRLRAVRKTTNGWLALCPAHEDHDPSLSIGEADDGRCLIHCFAGCPMEKVLEALKLQPEDLGPRSRRRRSSSRLLLLANDAGVEPFRAPDGESYITIHNDGHAETWPVTSPDAERWLRQLHFRAEEEALAPEVVAEAVATLDARAQFEGIEHEVHCRVAGDPDQIHIDRGDAAWTAIRVSSDGWALTADATVRFLRDPSTLALPEPKRGGDIEELREFTKCTNERSWMMLVGFLAMCFHPTGPYPIAYLTGEQGSAKSMLSKMVASLVDHRTAPLIMGAPPVRDLATIASSVHLIGFDNVSRIPPALSDALCQIATGAGYRARQLYTDANPFILEFRRPVLINAIGQVADRPDLLDRMALIEVSPIDPADRRTESDLWSAWEEARPRILGALLDGVAAALELRDEIELPG